MSARTTGRLLEGAFLLLDGLLALRAAWSLAEGRPGAWDAGVGAGLLLAAALVTASLVTQRRLVAWPVPLRAGLHGVAALVLAALLAPALAPFDHLAVHAGAPWSAPGGDHLLGTDAVGRDVLSRLLHGGRVSVPLALLAAVVAGSLGTLVGAVAGFAGGAVDTVLSWIVDFALALPRLVVLLAAVALFRDVEEGRTLLLAVLLGATGWMPVARVVRAEVLSLRERPFVRAARVLGASPARVVLRHVLPHVAGPALVQGTLVVGGTLLAEAALSFLGLGVAPPAPTWGGMAASGLEQARAWWAFLFPGLAVVAAVAVFQVTGDGLRAALAPEVRS